MYSTQAGPADYAEGSLLRSSPGADGGGETTGGSECDVVPSCMSKAPAAARFAERTLGAAVPYAERTAVNDDENDESADGCDGAPRRFAAHMIRPGAAYPHCVPHAL